MAAKKSLAKNKTAPRTASVAAFMKTVVPERRRADAEILLELFADITGESPVLWGPSIIGYGQYHYRYDSGREGDMLKTGFSPRKAHLVLYIIPGFEASAALREQLGKYRLGKSCLYINKLEDVHLPTLKKIIRQGWEIVSERYDCNDS